MFSTGKKQNCKLATFQESKIRRPLIQYFLSVIHTLLTHSHFHLHWTCRKFNVYCIHFFHFNSLRKLPCKTQSNLQCLVKATGEIDSKNQWSCLIRLTKTYIFWAAPSNKVLNILIKSKIEIKLMKVYLHTDDKKEIDL